MQIPSHQHRHHQEDHRDFLEKRSSDSSNSLSAVTVQGLFCVWMPTLGLPSLALPGLIGRAAGILANIGVRTEMRFCYLQLSSRTSWLLWLSSVYFLARSSVLRKAGEATAPRFPELISLSTCASDGSNKKWVSLVRANGCQGSQGLSPESPKNGFVSHWLLHLILSEPPERWVIDFSSTEGRLWPRHWNTV